MSSTLNPDTATLAPTEIPTPTSTSSPPNRPTNPFATDASPALILAFLALGIFAGGFLCMVLLRRYGVGCMWRERRLEIVAREAEVRDWAADVADAREQPSRKQKKALGPKPTLWDVRSIPLRAGEYDKGLNWRGMQPLSVEYTRLFMQLEDEAGLLEKQDETQVHPEPPRSRIQSFVRIFRRKPPPVASSSESITHDPSAHLHVAVTIAMPHPSLRREDQAVTPVYELGLTTIPWDDEKASFEVDAGDSSQAH